jgi:hypothetical protein
MQVGLNDCVLVVSLLYLSFDLQFEWESFSSCRQPIHKWLLVSYGLIIASRVAYIVGSLIQAPEAGEFLLNLRQRGTVLRCLMSITWLVIVPFSTFWSALGTMWILEVRRDSPECLPNSVNLWFLGFWQALSYLWIIVHCGLGAKAWFLERKLRLAEVDLEQIEDADVLARWGQVSRIHDYTSLVSASGRQGLAPAEIKALPSMVVPETQLDVEEECPICLHEIRPGDVVRQLGSCGHNFHRSCIDLWLLRHADCPLCKRKVKRAEDDESGNRCLV